MRSSVRHISPHDIVMRAVNRVYAVLIRRTVACKGIYLSYCGAKTLFSLLVHVACA